MPPNFHKFKAQLAAVTREPGTSIRLGPPHQQGLDAFVLERRAHEHRNKLSTFRRAPDSLRQHVGINLVTFEVQLRESIVAVGHVAGTEAEAEALMLKLLARRGMALLTMKKRRKSFISERIFEPVRVLLYFKVGVNNYENRSFLNG